MRSGQKTLRNYLLGEKRVAKFALLYNFFVKLLKGMIYQFGILIKLSHIWDILKKERERRKSLKEESLELWWEVSRSVDKRVVVESLWWMCSKLSKFYLTLEEKEWVYDILLMRLFYAVLFLVCCWPLYKHQMI